MDEQHFQQELRQINERISGMSPRFARPADSSDPFADQLQALNDQVASMQARSSQHSFQASTHQQPGDWMHAISDEDMEYDATGPPVVTSTTSPEQAINGLRSDVQAMKGRIAALEEEVWGQNESLSGHDEPAIFTPTETTDDFTQDAPLRMIPASPPEQLSQGPMLPPLKSQTSESGIVQLPSIVELDARMRGDNMDLPPPPQAKALTHFEIIMQRQMTCMIEQNRQLLKRVNELSGNSACLPLERHQLFECRNVNHKQRNFLPGNPGGALDHEQQLPAESITFRDREIARMDEQLGFLQERLRIGEGALAESQANACALEKLQGKLSDQIDSLWRRNGQLTRECEERGERLEQKEQELADATRKHEQAYERLQDDTDLQFWQYRSEIETQGEQARQTSEMLHDQKIESVEAELQSTKDELQNSKDKLQTRKAELQATNYSHWKAIRAVERECREQYTALQGRLSEREAQIEEQWRLIAGGEELVYERDAEISDLKRLLRAAGDDKDHGLLISSQHTSLIAERDAELQHDKQKPDRFTWPRIDEEIDRRIGTPNDFKLKSSSTRLGAFDGVRDRSCGVRALPRICEDVPAAKKANIEAPFMRIERRDMSNEASSYNRRSNVPARQSQHNDDAAHTAIRMPRVMTPPTRSCQWLHEAAIPPPLPAPIPPQPRHAASETNLKSRYAHQAQRTTKHRSMQDLRTDLQAYVESDAESGGRGGFGGEV